jgi:hypothetical protein
MRDGRLSSTLDGSTRARQAARRSDRRPLDTRKADGSTRARLDSSLLARSHAATARCGKARWLDARKAGSLLDG